MNPSIRLPIQVETSYLQMHTNGLFLGFTKSHEDVTQWQMEVK